MANYRKFLYPHPTHPEFNPDCRDFVRKRHLLARDYLYGDVLDAPCGCGWGASIYFENNPKIKSVIGIDLCQEALDYGRENYKNIEFISKDILELDYKEKFDCIVSFEALEHLTVSEGVKYTENIYEALKPGGIALFSTPDCNYLTTKEFPKCEADGKTQFHITLYAKQYLNKLLSIFEKVSFCNVMEKSFFVICVKKNNKLEIDDKPKIDSNIKTKVVMF